jgi:hypothetical protein
MTCPVCRHTVTGIDVIHRHRDSCGRICPASGAPTHITNHEGELK